MSDDKRQIKIKENKGSFTVSKHKDVVEAAYKLTLVEQRIILSCISKVNPFSKITPETEVFLSHDEYMCNFNVSNKTARKELKEGVNSLWERELSVLEEDGKTRTIRWLSEKINDKYNSEIGVMFSAKIIPYLTSIQPPFSTYKLKEVCDMKSVNSIRIYEIMIQFRKSQKRYITIEWLKKQLMLGDKYPRFYDFNKNVLEKAKTEINKYSDITLTIETKSERKKIVGVTLSFKYKKNKAPNKKKIKITNKVIDRESKIGELREECGKRLVSKGGYEHSPAKPTSSKGLVQEMRKEAEALGLDFPFLDQSNGVNNPSETDLTAEFSRE